MRKLAPMFVITSIALAAGNAVANMDKTTTTSATTSTTASPTVSPNTGNPQGLSYSDKSNTSPGTNAVMGDASKPMTASTDDDKNLHKTKKKLKKAKLAHNTTPIAKSEPTVKSDALKSDASVSSSPMTSRNPPTATTNAAAANSTTGRSSGQ